MSTEALPLYPMTLYKHIAKLTKVSRQAEHKWRVKGLPSNKKQWLALKSIPLKHKGRWFVRLEESEYEITAAFAGELKAWRELTASVRKTDNQLRASVKTKA